MRIKSLLMISLFKYKVNFQNRLLQFWDSVVNILQPWIYNNKGDNLRMVREFVFMFLFGGILYSLIEIAYRGRTHWSMTLTGGVVLVILYVINIKMQPTSILLRCLIGCIIITCIEFSVGYIVNIRLKLNVWDYGSQPFNLMGQICPAFSAVWFMLCIPADYICTYMRTVLNTG